MIEPIYDVPAFAKRLDIGLSNAYRLVRNKKIKAARAGKLIRITESEVMAFLKGGGGSGTTSNEPRAA